MYKLICTILSFSALLSFNISYAQQGVSINSTGANPDSTAMLDVNSSNRGILIPRLNLTNTSSALPLTTPTTSLLVYNQATAGDVTPGYYYWNGAAWTRLATGSGASGWLTNGNTLTGTLPASPNEFFGSINGGDVIFKANNYEYLRLNTSGYFGVGTNNPQSLLHIRGNSPVFRVHTLTNMTDPSIWLVKEGVRTMEIKLSDVGPNYGILFIDQNSGTPRMTINASSGNVGIGIGANNPGARLDVKSSIRLSGATSGYVGLTVPAVAGSTTYTLPSADGASGQVLSTDGTGNLSWIDAGGGGGGSSCPAGYADGGDFCIEIDEHGSSDWYTAVSACYSEGGHLCSSDELYIGCALLGTLNNTTDDWEWTNNWSAVSDLQLQGNGGCQNRFSDGWNFSYAYRCCMNKSASGGAASTIMLHAYSGLGNGTWYIGPAFGDDNTASINVTMTRDGILKDMQVRCYVQSTGSPITFTVMKNGAVETDLEVTVSTASTGEATGSDLTGSVSFSAGDTFCVKLVNSGSAMCRAYRISFSYE